MDIKKLIKSQKALYEQLTKAVAAHKKSGKAKKTESYYRVRIDSLNKIWDQFQQNNLQIYQTESPESDAYIASDTYELAEEIYVEYLSEFQEELQAIQSTQDKAKVSDIDLPKKEVKLPAITIPKFDGSYRSWRSFHDLFQSIVHKDSSLSKVQKFHYLKTCVVGEAERLLRQYDITESNYQLAWEFLDKRYNNKRVLVNTQLKLLLNQPLIKNESAQAIKELLDHTDESLHELRALDISTENWDAFLVFTLVQKLPVETHQLWEQEQGNKTSIPSYADLSKFLEARFRTLEALQEHKHTKPSTHPPLGKPQPKNTFTFLNKSQTCIKCKQNHSLFRCPAFKKLTPSQRFDFTNKVKICKNCLASGHNLTNCPSQRTCLICGKKHNTLIHLEERSKPNNITKPNSNTKPQTQGDLSQKPAVSNETAPQTFFAANPTRALLSTALVKIESPAGHTQILRALIDSGSQVSFITEAASNRLKLKRTPTNIEVTGLGKTHTAYANAQVSLKLASLHSTFQTDFQALVLKKITDFIPSERINVTDLHYIKHLQLADPKYFAPGQIDLLLGADIYAQIIESGVIKGREGDPTAQYTQLGWILMGKVKGNNTSAIKALTVQVEAEYQLEKQLKRFWEIEEIPQNISHPDDNLCEKIYNETHKRLSNGQYQVSLPFKSDDGPDLGQTRHIAIKQYLQLEKRLVKDPELHTQYKQCINEYSQLDHMEEVPRNEIESEMKSTTKVDHYYLPHHAVLKESSTTKLRVVFNASAKSSNGKSLNEQLLIGPTIQPTLWTIILRWRLYKYAFTADIEKMYRMVQMHPKHRKYQRILWRNNVTEPIKDFQLTTITFGTAPAPYLAIRTLQQLSKDERDNFPLAAESLTTDFYVDDLLTGAHNVQNGVRLQKELINVLKKGGFNLRKWTANHPDLLEHIPSEHRESKTILDLSEHETIKTLGLQWHPIKDEFSFQVKLQDIKTHFTKRSVLSETASLFDPLGWLAPSIIIAKIFIQKLWLSGCAWDETLPESMANEWIKFREDLQNLSSIQIPRWTNFSPSAHHIELHGFCDASVRAYAAAIYLRVMNKDGIITTHLLTAKTRVAPTKPVSLPRLELCGAVILSRLIKQVQIDLKLTEVPVFAWSDSEITLAWIQGQPSRWKTFVANRVAEIQENINPTVWKYVPSKHNPADGASRGIYPTELHNSNLWWNGPSWLCENTENWPLQPTSVKSIELESRKIKVLTCSSEEFPWLIKYSSFPKLIRIIALCIRFSSNCKNKTEKRTTNFLTCQELLESEARILALLQKLTFPEEVNCFKNNKTISQKSRLISLNPFLDEHQLIRVGGRLENSILTYNQKHPIILPNNHHISNILIDHIHQYTLHGGTQLILNTLRNKYWILNARNTIRHRIHTCIKCFRTKPKISQQIMGNLPSPRVNPSLAFEHTGVDYAGPIDVKTSKLRNAKIIKGYLSLFVCMATKAIHIEVVSDLTTTAFIAALKRFISRRGLCSHLYSDCGTNFVGANKELNNKLKHLLKNLPAESAQESTLTGITWHFNPPAAPHFGGLWEAGVKAVKAHLKRTLQNSTLTFEELTTVICQIEACINSRPLTPLSNDPTDYNVLTPGHFLTGRNLLAIPEPSIFENISTLKRWQYVQYLTAQFWKKWSGEYMHNLQQRTKWRLPHDDIKLNDLVLIQDDRCPPTKWPLGRVININPGIDNKVRVATIKTSTSSFTRPITKLCRIPLLTDKPQPTS